MSRSISLVPILTIAMNIDNQNNIVKKVPNYRLPILAQVNSFINQNGSILWIKSIISMIFPPF